MTRQDIKIYVLEKKIDRLERQITKIVKKGKDFKVVELAIKKRFVSIKGDLVLAKTHIVAINNKLNTAETIIVNLKNRIKALEDAN